MIFEINTKYSECDVVRDGKVVGTIKFNAYDVEKRSAFYSLYNSIVATGDKIFTNDIDKLGVPSALPQATEEAVNVFSVLENGIDKIFGADTVKLLTDNNKDPAVLLQFLAFVSNEFRIATGLKINKYINQQESDVLI